jgi:MscS family membrane protein
MPDFMEKTYYDNTLIEWTTAAAIILGTFVVVKIVYFVFSRLLRRFTERTKTQFDDVLVDLSEAPTITIFTVLGIWAGLRTLTMSEPARSTVDGAALLCVVLCVTWLISRAIEAVFREILQPLAEKTETDLDDQLLPIARKGSKLVVWAMGIIVALNNVGYDVGAVLAGLGIGGLALAMAARDTVANMFGGVTVFVDRPFSVHDRIRIDDYEGFVQEIGIRTTRLQTIGGPVVIIPNSKFSGSEVENITVNEGLQSAVVVGLTYDTSHERMQRAMQIIEEIIAEHPETELWDIGFDAFGDFSLNIRAEYYVKSKRRPLPVRSEINMAVLERFNAEGLDFAFPTQTLHVSRADSPAA